MQNQVADLHTHGFNAGFLPVEGVLLSRNVPPALAGPLYDIVSQLLERSWPPPAVDQLSAEEAKAVAEREEFYSILMARLIGSGNTARNADFISSVAAAVPEVDLKKLAPVIIGVRPYLERVGKPQQQDTLTSDLAQTQVASSAELRATLREYLTVVARLAGPVETSSGSSGTPQTADELDSHFGSLNLGGFVEWVFVLLGHERRIASAFGQAWDGDPPFSFRVDHMMDMQHHYRGRPPLYDFVGEQMGRMRDVATVAQPLTFMFTAFDPFRDECLTIIEAAKSGGFAGVKFYCPNGFRPIGNKPCDIVDGPAASVVDERNLAFFRMCVENDLPIFTHCTLEGMESRPGAGKLAHPDGWKAVLAISGLENLRLCFGHAGGQDGWIDSDPDDDSKWAVSTAAIVVELCNTYPNVYCDFGYFDHLLAPGENSIRFRRRLSREISRSRNETFGRKCCYGTDWTLITQEHLPRRYEERFANLLADKDYPVLKRHRDDILHRNAQEYLALPKFLQRSAVSLSDRERTAIAELITPAAS